MFCKKLFILKGKNKKSIQSKESRQNKVEINQLIF